MSRATSRAVRLNNLRKRLEERPLTVVELAELEGVGRRSVERDLNALREMGEDLEPDASNRYFIKPPPSSLNNVEALALYTAARMLQHTRIGGSHYRSAMAKLTNQLPEPASSMLRRADERPRDTSRERTFEFVAKAWLEQRVLRCRYLSVNSGKTARRDLHIYFIDINPRGREAYAYAVDRASPEAIKVFKLARMSQVELLAEVYTIPDSFDPVEMQKGSFGVVAGEAIEVRVRVGPDVVTSFLEGAAGELLSSEESPDGGLVATLQATLDSKGRALEIQPWLLGWGGSIEVLEPEFLRRSVAEAHRVAAGLYP